MSCPQTLEFDSGAPEVVAALSFAFFVGTMVAATTGFGGSVTFTTIFLLMAGFIPSMGGIKVAVAFASVRSAFTVSPIIATSPTTAVTTTHIATHILQILNTYQLDCRR